MSPIFTTSPLVVSVFAQDEPVRIHSVSTLSFQENTNKYGSLYGGTTLYIKVTGHDTNIASNNAVFIGSSPCNIESDSSVNDVQITCVTSAPSDSSSLINLPVIVRTLGKQDSICAQADSYACIFTYSSGYTPSNEEIIPRFVSSGGLLTWLGQWRITNTKNITGLYIGSSLCDRYFKGLNEDTEYPGSQLDQPLSCNVGYDLPAGFYTTSFLSKQGYSKNKSKLTTVRSTTLSDAFNVQIVPEITDISHSSITSEGAILSLTVSGLRGVDTSAINIDYNGNACSILSFDKPTNMLTCSIPSAVTYPGTGDFLAGGGVRLQTFSTTMTDISNVVTDYRKAASSRTNTLTSDTIIATTEIYDIHDPDDGNTYPTLAYVLTGHFTPPRDGTYYFEQSASYQSRMYIQTSSTTSSTDSSTLNLLVEVDSDSGLRQASEVSQGVSLLSANSYYFEIFVLSNSPYSCYHTTGIRIPTGDSNTYENSSSQVTSVVFNYPFTKEIASITHKDLSSSTTGTFQIHFIQPTTATSQDSATYWSVPTTTFNKTSTCTDIQQHFSSYLLNVKSTCTKVESFDTSSYLIGATWTLTFTTHRTQVNPTFILDTTVSQTPVFTVLQTPGASLSGTYSLQVNGIYVTVLGSTQLQYNTDGWAIVASMQSILGFEGIDYSRTGEFIDGASFVFDFYGSPQIISVTAQSANLLGESGVTISINVNDIRSAGDGNLRYVSIEPELLTQRSTVSPGLTLKLNGVTALCQDSCLLQFLADTSAPKFSAYVENIASKTLTITGVTAASGTSGLTKDSFRVLYANQLLFISSFSGSTLIASFSSKIGQASKPTVDQIGVGAAIPASTVEYTYVTSSITAVTPTTINSQGGAILIITGQYFPSIISSELVVTVGYFDATVISTTPTMIKVVAPQLYSTGSKDVTVSINGLSSAAFSITCDDSTLMTITSLSNTIASPTSPTIITVIGTGFPSSATDLTAVLDSMSGSTVVSLSTYEVTVISSTATSAQVKITGGEIGEYRLRLILSTGSNEPSGTGADLIELRAYISALSATTSSRYGGTSLTITGTGLPASADNAVVTVGAESCEVTSSSSTSITCILPNLSATMVSATSVSYPLKVSSSSFPTVVAVVDPNVSLNLAITYSDSNTPTGTSLDSTSGTSSSTLTITGSNFPSSAATAHVYFVPLGGIDSTETYISATVLSSSSSTVQATVPFAPAAKYNVVIQSATGLSNTNLSYTITLDILSISSTTNISSSGQVIQIVMSGLYMSTYPAFRLGGLYATVLSYTASTGSVTVSLPAGLAAGSQTLEFAQAAIPSSSTQEWSTYATQLTVVTQSWTVSAISVSSQTITVTGDSTGMATLASAQLTSSTGSVYIYSSKSTSGTTATITFSSAPAGTYTLSLLNAGYQYPTYSSVSNTVAIALASSTTLSTASVTSASFAGGQSLTITSTNFSTTSSHNSVQICGADATVVSSSSTSLTITVPPIITTTSISKYAFPASTTALTPSTTFADSDGSSVIVDGQTLAYYTSSNTDCYVGLDFGSSTRVIASIITITPRSIGVVDASLFEGAIIQGSNDKSTWTSITSIGSEFHLGSNIYRISDLIANGASTTIQSAFRYFRLSQTSSTSACEIAEMQVYGWKSSSAVESSTTLTCPITVSTNNSPIVTLSQTITFDQSVTYLLKYISPAFGAVNGGTSVTLTLDRAPSTGATLQVLLDGTACTSASFSGAVISCTSAARASSTGVPTLVQITINSKPVVNNQYYFYYGNLWTDSAAWTSGSAPGPAENVDISNQTIIVNRTPISGFLGDISIESNACVIFATNVDIVFQARSITVNSLGQLIIGSQSQPIVNGITIVLGDSTSSSRNDQSSGGINVINGSLSIYGQLRGVTWSDLSSTAEYGATQIAVNVKNTSTFDWTIGDVIEIASTDFVHTHSERRVITAISISASIATITFTTPLSYRHVSISETYNSLAVPMRAEVALISRNVVIQGPSATSTATFGGFVSVTGDQSIVQLGYAEFQRVGQVVIVDGDDSYSNPALSLTNIPIAQKSFIEGISIHDSYSRGISLEGTSYLSITNSVIVNTVGSGISLVLGTEVKNTISDNLIMGTRQSWVMDTSDAMAASYYVSNPSNTIKSNRAAGGDFYGFAFVLQSRAAGTSDICPSGSALTYFQSNKAHSYNRVGLYLTTLTQLQYPCQSPRDDTLANPFSSNLSTQITLKDFAAYRNVYSGVEAEQVGNMVFYNFAIVDNSNYGFMVHLTNSTESAVQLSTSVVVGKSAGNAPLATQLVNARGLVTPRTDGFTVMSVQFANFELTMTPLKSSAGGETYLKRVTGGKLTKFTGISYSSVTSTAKVYWDGFKREIYEDLDGSLTGKGSHVWVAPTSPQIASISACSSTSTAEKTTWNNGLICTKQVVRIEFSNPISLDLLNKYSSLYVQSANSSGKSIGGSDASLYGVSKQNVIKNAQNDLKNGYVATFVAGSVYTVQWNLTTPIDFTHLSVQLSPYHTGTSTSDTIVLKFPYNETRNTFEIGNMVANEDISFFANATSLLTNQQDSSALSKILNLNCKHGDWFNHIDGSALYLCLNENGRSATGPITQHLDRLDVNALPCDGTCIPEYGTCTKDGVSRATSVPTTWRNILVDGTIINADGSLNIFVPCAWDLLVDTDLLNYDTIVIDGTLTIDPTQDIDISTKGIYIRGGSLVAEGSTPDTPYTMNLNIQLTGSAKSQSSLFQVDTGIKSYSKAIVNTGTFKLLGVVPTTTAARLTASLNSGSSSITVNSVTDWAVGDTIAIAPTQLDQTQEEVFTITGISGTTVTLNTTASYYHYGAAAVTITETWVDDSTTQEMDLRAQVLHLSRNIKITGASSTDGYGCRVVNYYQRILTDSTGAPLPTASQTLLRGSLNWSGVEMANCGQSDQGSGLEFLSCEADSANTMSKVLSSSFRDCYGSCVGMYSSDDITFTSNNLFRGTPILLNITNSTGLAITYNHFIGARTRTNYVSSDNSNLYDMTAHISFPSDKSIIANEILIAHNYMQGSQGPCLVVPHISCSAVTSLSAAVGVFDNQAQTCLVGAMFSDNADSACQYAGRVAVSRSTKGLIVNPTTISLSIDHVLAAESNINIAVRFGYSDDEDSTMTYIGKLSNSAIYAVAITNDATAYSTSDRAALCSYNYGTQSLVVTEIGEDFPLFYAPTSFDTIDSSAVFDSQFYQSEVKYVRFQNTYTDANLSLCTTNSMLTTHPGASDASAGIYNTQVTCEECDVESYFQFSSANPTWSGWVGGCGSFLCSGPENVLVIDSEGDLFGSVITSAISHNAGIQDSSTCTKQSTWNNGYKCTGNEYAQLEWESQASDANTRVVSPVLLSSFDATYTNTINMQKEWKYVSDTPQNTRQGTFVSTTLLNKQYKLEYNGVTPYNTVHRLQPRTLEAAGEPTIYVMLNVTYQVPMHIEISTVDSDSVDSYIDADNIDVTTKTGECGANTYDITTQSAFFVVNGSPSCIVRARVLNTLRLTFFVQMSSSDFLYNVKKVAFLQYIASFLSIVDPARIKILSVASQSTDQTMITVDITEKPAFNEESDPATDYTVLSNYLERLTRGLTDNTIPGLSSYTYSLTSSSIYVGADTNGNLYAATENKDDGSDGSGASTALIVVLAVIGALVVAGVATLIYVLYKRNKAKHINLASSDSQSNKSNLSRAKVYPLDIPEKNFTPNDIANSSFTPFNETIKP